MENTDIRILAVYKFDNKIRLGSSGDGGYVIGEIDGGYDCYISAGVSDEESFSRDFINKYDMNKNICYAYDGTIPDYPYNYTDKITFIKKNIGGFEDNNISNLSFLMEHYNNIFLKMDIESGEYPWLLSVNEHQLNKFKQLVIEFHGITQDCHNTRFNNEFKTIAYSDRLKCLEKLSNTHYVIHAHGNNCADVVNGIPDVIELTYINKNYFKSFPGLNPYPLPSILDFHNSIDRPFIDLNFYPFVTPLRSSVITTEDAYIMNEPSHKNCNWILDIKNHEQKIYSRGTQDGIIRYITSNLNITNKFCLELGFDSPTLTGGSGANTADLILNFNWDSLLLGGVFENPSINLYKHFLTTENICNILNYYNVPVELGYLSIDVDSTDLWLLDKVLEKYKPCFYSVEYNLNIPIEYAITFPNDPSEVWQCDKMFGASLKCFDIVAKKYGYSFVYAMDFEKTGGHDAFFIRNDLIENCNFPEITEFTCDLSSSPHNPCKSGRHSLMLDYEVFLQTNDLEFSQKNALEITTRFIAN